jgi:hypothetical protein
VEKERKEKMNTTNQTNLELSTAEQLYLDNPRSFTTMLEQKFGITGLTAGNRFKTKCRACKDGLITLALEHTTDRPLFKWKCNKCRVHLGNIWDNSLGLIGLFTGRKPLEILAEIELAALEIKDQSRLIHSSVSENERNRETAPAKMGKDRPNWSWNRTNGLSNDLVSRLERLN